MAEPMEETTVVDGEPTLPTGEKRSIEIHGDDELAEPQLRKKPRNGCELGPNLRRVAEIVLVMSTMTALRAGKKPTDAEVELMAEARAKLVQICEGLAPKDIVGREGISSLIEDLGLHGNIRDQKLGFRGPRLTIAEKLAQTKKKMEDSKKYIPPSGYGSHPTQKHIISSIENRGPLPSVRMFPSDKSSPVPNSVGGTAGTLPSGHVSVAGSTSMQVQPQLTGNEVRAHNISSGFPINQQGRDPSSLHGIERPLNGTYGSQMQVNSSVNHSLASAPTWSAQTQSALSAKGGPEHKFPNHSAANAQGTTDSRALRSSSQAARDQSFRPPIPQTGTGNMAGLQPHLQSINFVQGPSVSNSHNEIVKIIQKLLQPQLPDHPTWNPPSRDYMNKAVTCQTCQVTINEIDSVLICDACEKGFHLKCVQSPNQRAIPRGEWHCPRCLTISNGKPLPPKYGRVMRSNPPPKLSVNTSGSQPPEKSLGAAVEQKASAGQLKLVSNGGLDLLSHHQPAEDGSNANESSGIKIPNAEEAHGNNLLPIRKDIDEKPTSSTSLNTPAKSLGMVCEPSSAEISSEVSAQHIKSSQAPIGEDGSSAKSEPPEESQTAGDNSSNPKPPDIPQIVDQQMGSNGPEEPYSTASSHDTSNVKKDGHEVLQENNVENFEASIINREQSGTSSNDLHDVEWIGDPHQLTDTRAYYKSCRVDGVTYKVEEFSLFHSNNGKLMPYRLQSLYHEYESGLNWAILKQCYFHEDLPKEVAHLCPCSPEQNEVYTSDGNICLAVGLIRSPCEVLPVAKYKEEHERRKQLGPVADDGIKPTFLCKWFYTEANKEFVPFTDAVCESFSVMQGDLQRQVNG
ncbi:PHD finger protein [Cucurbita argyrosperma subsp. argyrosperma]|nr:PHD finger protein [Cucurbita argyrosperma subsp. argyrosperma]